MFLNIYVMDKGMSAYCYVSVFHTMNVIQVLSWNQFWEITQMTKIMVSMELFSCQGHKTMQNYDKNLCFHCSGYI